MRDRNLLIGFIVLLSVMIALKLPMNAIALTKFQAYSSEAECRSCHGITVDWHHSLVATGEHGCMDCHTLVYNNTTGQYYPTVIRNCLECHQIESHSDCIACHNATTDVNTSLFGKHSNINSTDGYNNVTNGDCWICHNRRDMNRSSVYLCESCHSNNSGIVSISNSSLIISDLSHGMTTCKNCHAPTSYHNNGTVGPLGTIERILREYS